MESSSNKNVSDTVAKVFNKTIKPFYLLVVFFVVYLVVFIGAGRQEGNESSLRIMFDSIFLSIVIAYLAFSFFSMTPAAKQKLLTTDYLDFYDDDLSLFSLMLFVICFYLLLFLMRISVKPISVVLIEGITWVLLATLIIHNCLKYFFNVNVLDSIRTNTFRLTDASGNLVDASGNLVDASGNIIVKKAPKVPEVFNIPDNLYMYEDAQAICQVYDSRLATYDEIEQSYENGAEWCNYGWSAEQMAFFPTQKKTWDELQKTDANKNHCGRPGVNGGFFDNPYIKFGVNCFGIKPDADKDDLTRMNDRKDRPIPKTEDEKKIDEKVEFWKNNKDVLLNVSSFNRDKWSRY
jgi:hypothetical protein